MAEDYRKTWIYNSLLNSPAWRSLRGTAPHILLHFYQRRKMEPKKRKCRDERKCKNARALQFTYAEAKAMGFTEHEFRKAIDSLISRGFIDIVEYGGGTEHKKNIYGISERWIRYGEIDFVTVKRTKHKRGYCSDEKRHNSKPHSMAIM